jgi:hypothetical protein
LVRELDKSKFKSKVSNFRGPFNLHWSWVQDLAGCCRHGTDLAQLVPHSALAGAASTGRTTPGVHGSLYPAIASLVSRTMCPSR